MRNMLRGLYHLFKHPELRRKYSKLYVLSRNKSQNRPQTIEDMRRYDSSGDLEKLCSIVLEDKDCLSVLQEHNGSKETLHKLFGELEIAGAGQFIGDRYIPYWALAEPWALEYLLRRHSQSASLRETAFRVVVFYGERKSIAWLNEEETRT